MRQRDKSFSLFSPAGCIIFSVISLLGSFSLWLPAQAQFSPFEEEKPYEPAPLEDRRSASSLLQEKEGSTALSQSVVRIDRLETEIRSLKGQIEQLQFGQKKLEDHLQQFQKEVDFRFDENKSLSNHERSASPASAASSGESFKSDPEITHVPAAQERSQERSQDRTMSQNSGSQNSGRSRKDAFNPEEHPDAPGLPRPLGQERESDKEPLDLTHGLSGNGLSGNGLGGKAASTTSKSPSSSSSPALEAGLEAFRAQNYEKAEASLKAHLEATSAGPARAEALFYLGEAQRKQGKTREAAESFLKLSREAPQASQTPEALLNLGLMLEKLGLKPQACSAWNELIGPGSSIRPDATLRAHAQRERKRAQCPD